jgi:hypothetical protein
MFSCTNKAVASLMYIVSHLCLNNTLMMNYSSFSEPLNNVFGIETASE